MRSRLPKPPDSLSITLYPGITYGQSFLSARCLAFFGLIYTPHSVALIFQKQNLQRNKRLRNLYEY